MNEVPIGIITHYFSKLGVAAIELTQGELQVGDTVHIKGHTSDFMQQIDSMEIDHHSVNQATIGQNIGFKAAEHVREHDVVCKVTA
jgi:translation elongation factor EF-1alpha